MKYVIEIETDNDAFLPNPNDETVRILQELCCVLEQEEPAARALFDVNGNRVGRAYVARGKVKS